jgi:hypothetical protein
MYFPFEVLSHSTISTFLIFYVFHSTFCPIQRFVPFGVFSIRCFLLFDLLFHSTFFPFDVFSHSAFFPFDVLSHSAFCLSTFCRLTFFTFGIFYFDILSVNPVFCCISVSLSILPSGLSMFFPFYLSELFYHLPA